MKLTIRTLIPLILLLLTASLAAAQEPASSIDSLYVAFWPDYDDPSVLVLMTGDLPADTSLPAEVTIPLPPQAQVNAVARVDADGNMADTQFNTAGDSLSFITPDPRFRVEFYVPYEQDGEQRFFEFTWDADLDVEELIAEVQQPLNAADLITQPPPATVGTGPNDGLTYHALPAQAVPAGTPFEMSFRYDMSNPGLTAGAAAPIIPNPAPAESSSSSGDSAGTNWLLIGAGVVILLLAVALIWLLATRNNGGRRPSGKSNRPRKPAPKARESQARFCHNCGTPAQDSDQFCRSCGTKLK